MPETKANRISSVGKLLDAGDGMPIGQLPAYHARRDPARIALVVGDEQIRRDEFEARANRRAHALAAEGVGQGDFVTVALPNSVEFYETTFALWKLGAVPNIVSPKLSDYELGALVQLVDPKLVIGPQPDRLPGRKARPAGMAPDPLASAEPLPEAVSPHWKAMSSGGSTGRPKIIVDQQPGRWDPTSAVLGQEPDDIILNPGTLSHNAPFLATQGGLFTGAQVIDMVRFDAARTLELIEQWQVRWVCMAPTMMHRIWRLPEAQRGARDLSSLRAVWHLGAACPVWLKRAWIDWLGPERIFELYAGTERPGATMITGPEWLDRPGSVGRAQEGSSIKVLDEDGQDCAPGQIGEIHFLPDGGRNSTYRYLGAQARARGEWESLGDLGHFDADGYLYLADRRDDMIVTGGVNVYPAEVEGAVEACPGVKCCIVIGLPDDEWGQTVHAIVECAPGMSVDAQTVAAFAAERLAPFKRPKTVEMVHAPLRDEAGKARRSALRAERLPLSRT